VTGPGGVGGQQISSGSTGPGIKIEGFFFVIRQVIEASQLQSPFNDIEFFVQQKFKIAGKTPGSGNTTNIGSISSNKISDFKEGRQGFASKTEFEEYWRAYKRP